MKYENTVLQDIIVNLIEKIKKSPDGFVNIITSDTETTGLKEAEMTQFAAKVTRVSIAKDGKSLIFDDVERISSYYYPQKPVEPMAAFVTNIVREVDLKDKEYVKSLKEVWKEKNKVFDQKHLIVLKDNIPSFQAKDFTDIIEKYNVQLIAGHNYFSYDYLTVLKATYGVSISNLEILDTMYFPLHTKEAKSLRGKTLDNEVKKVVSGSSIIDKERAVVDSKLGEEKLIAFLTELGLLSEYQTVKDIPGSHKQFEAKLGDNLSKFKLLEYQAKTLKEKYEDNLKLREEAHDAIIDVELNEFLTRYQLQKLYEDIYVNPSEKSSLNQTDEVETITKVKDDRGYRKDDLLYINTQINGDNILKIEEAIEFAIDNELESIVIVDNMLSNVFRYKDTLKKIQTKREEKNLPVGNLKLLFGYEFSNPETGDKNDVIFKNTLEYRKALPILFANESGVSYEEKLSDLKSTTDNLIIPSDSISKPKMASVADKHNYFVFKKYKQKEIFTKQESEVFNEQATIDKSLTGIYTSDEKQNWLKQQMASFEAPDFAFYNDMGLSAFPDLKVLYSGIDKEPETMDEYIDVLRKFVKEKASAKSMSTIIANLNKERAKANPPKAPITQEMYDKRIEDELEILRSMGDTDYIKYFFLVSDWEKNIPFGPGRGSVGGSLIAFEINVTDTNPLEFDLLFERFLDPSRPDYPDIDFDVMDKHYVESVLREENNKKVKENQDYNNPLYSIYTPEVLDKYVKGEHNFIGKIKTFSVATRKVLLNNFIRMALFPHGIQKAIRDEWSDDLSIAENVRVNTKRDEILERYPIEYFENLESLVNLYTNFGVHAAGVLAYPHHANCIGPVDENNTSHFDKKDIEKLKMIKMDALGLNTLLVVNEIISKIKEADPMNEIFKNNFDARTDPEVLKALQDGFTTATFQMESGGMKRILKDLAPIEFEDLIACTALYRPGPMDSIPSYISLAQAAKREKYNIEYVGKKEFEKMSEDDQSKMIVKARQQMLDGGVNELQIIDDDVIVNVITRQPFLESADFAKETKEKYTRLQNGTYDSEDAGQYEVMQKIINKYNIDNEDDFVNKIREIEEYINNDPIYAAETSETYKTLVYQEQIMFYSMSAAGYTKAESNDLRKAIGKKIPEKMAQHKIKLVAGLVEKGMPEEIADYLWNKIESFGKYAFNKSHAASYSIITYMTQYYKEKYPMIAYSTMLKHVPEKGQMTLIKEIRDRGMDLKLQKLDENFSLDFKYEGNTIYVPLSYVKGLGEKNLYSLISLLQTYEVGSLEELILFQGKVDKTTLENLGALGFFEKQMSDGQPFSEISQKEWYYLADQKNRNKDEKLLTDTILNTATKPILKKLQTEIGNKYGETLYGNEALVRELNILAAMQKEYELLERNNDDVDLGGIEGEFDTFNQKESNVDQTVNFYEEIQKQIEKVQSELDKDTKMTEDLRSQFQTNIDAGTYTFFAEGDNAEGYKDFVSEKSRIVKKYAIELRVAIQESKQRANIPSYETPGQNLSDRVLTQQETEDVYVKKQLNIFENQIDLQQPPVTIDDLYYQPTQLNGLSPKEFQFLEPEKKGINIIYIEEFLPKAELDVKSGKRGLFLEKNGKKDGEWVKSSQVKDFFDDINDRLRTEYVAAVGYMTFFDLTADEFAELDEEEQRTLFLEAIETKLKPIIRSDVQNIIVAGKNSKDSRLTKYIERLREKKFLPKKGETHRVLMDGIGKNVAFVNTMFPYKGLNEDLYNTRIQEIGKVIDPEFKLNPSEPKQEPVVASTHSKVSHTPQRPESPKDSVLLKITLRTKFNNNETFILSDDGSYINDKGDTFTIKEEDKVVTNGQKEKVTMLSFNNNILSSPKEVPVQHFETISTDAVKQELVSIDTITKGGGKLKMSKISPLTFMCIYQNRELTVLLTDEQEQELLSGETGEVKVIINGKQPRGIVISDIETTIKRPIASGNTPKGSGPKPCIKCGKYPCECFAPKR